MGIDESAFHKHADEALRTLLDVLDRSIGDVADVDLQGGMLTIALEDGREFAINKHAASRQLWLSSPVSGAWHFVLDDDRRRWCATRDPAVELRGLVGGEIAAATGYTLGF